MNVLVKPEIVQYAAFGALLLAVVALLGAVVALRSAARSRNALRSVGPAPVSTPGIDPAVAAELRRGIRRVGLVRYDALADMGGRMSFSVALLDDDANGVVISAINGRTESRCYGKAITGGAAEQELSPEEKDAINRALAPR